MSGVLAWRVRPPALVAALALCAGCAGPAHSPGVATSAAPLAYASSGPCASLPALLLGSIPGGRLTLASSQPADSQGHPAHCLLQGYINQRSGHGGTRYAITFELRLPQGWTGRLLHQLNNGTGGQVVPAWGALGVMAGPGQDALSRGFAVLSSDDGHDADDPANLPAGLVRGSVFGLDAQARRDFGYNAINALWPLAQHLVQRHYGQPPRRNYLAGCGNGGRQALVAASRWGGRYDGVLAGAPGLQQAQAALQAAWDVRQWSTVHADPRRAFSPANLQWVARQVLARCDAHDLLVDGIVADLPRCQASMRLADLQCRAGDAGTSAGSSSASRSSAGKASACLSAAQVQALAQSLAGPHHSRGTALYSDWPWDAGIGAAGWRTWKLESSVPAWDGLPINSVLGAGALAQVYSTPPATLDGTAAGLLAALQRFDFDHGAARIQATNTQFSTSAVDLLDPPDATSPRLATLAQHGGKVLIYHGNSDPAFSVNATLAWAGRLQRNLGAAAASQVARIFQVPGMGHCQGGPATDQFDALGALQAWVEDGRAPERIVAQVNPGNPELPAGWSAKRSRPLCPWPQVARYAGGNTELAASFRCAAP